MVLRLAYHDAGTFSKLEGDGGLNASIQYELSRPENFGLKRGWGVLQQVRHQARDCRTAGGRRSCCGSMPHMRHTPLQRPEWKPAVGK